MFQSISTNLLTISVLLVLLGCTSDRQRTPVGPPVGMGDAGVPARDSAIDPPMTDGGPVARDAGPPDGPGRGEACDAGACGEGLECVTDGTVSVCVGLCDATDYTGCLRTESCNVPIDDTRSGCFASCDLLTAEGCPSGSNCGVFGDATGAVYKGCDSAGTRTQGEDCDSSNKCAPGHVCAYWSRPPHISGWECRQFCDLAGTDGPACPGDTTCSSAPREADPFAAIDGLGACR